MSSRGPFTTCSLPTYADNRFCLQPKASLARKSHWLGGSAVHREDFRILSMPAGARPLLVFL